MKKHSSFLQVDSELFVNLAESSAIDSLMAADEKLVVCFHSHPRENGEPLGLHNHVLEVTEAVARRINTAPEIFSAKKLRHGRLAKRRVHPLSNRMGTADS